MNKATCELDNIGSRPSAMIVLLLVGSAVASATNECLAEDEMVALSDTKMMTYPGCRLWSQNISTFILISLRAKIPKYPN